ncbi:MAG: XRE family transcriptional regulator [Myxococcales bacterium]|nr:XRE family transcriptional regulator [Myxococcales bacterium]
MNLEQPRADALARDCAGNLSVLRRLMPSNPGRLPRWAEAPTRSLLAALLVGGWDAESEGDRSIVALLAGTNTYDEVEAELERYRGHFDQPLQKVGTVWRVASPLDAWLNLARHLSDRDLDRFAHAALAVYSVEDPRFALPAHERWMAPVLGVVPAQSGWLRRGIGHTLILLAVRGRAAAAGDAGRRVDAIVNKLLDGANPPRWWSLARDLRLLAEASPAAFLSAIEDSLDRDKPPIGVLFGADPGGLSGTEYLSDLLWALEALAWSPEWLERVSLVLARLDRIDPAPSSRHRNRPGEALSSIFLLWHPQTYAPLDQRLRVLDVLRGRESDASWRLLRGILPTGHGLATPTARPRWRDVVPDPDRVERVTNRLVQRSANEISRRLVDDAGTNVARWHELLKRLGDLLPDAERAVRTLNAVEPTLVAPTDRLALWTDLRKTIHRHREFPGVEWALPERTVGDLEAIYRRLTPPDELDQLAWLFALDAPLLHPPAGWEAREQAADAARIDAARTLYRTRGLAGVVALAPKTAQPGYLGKALFDADLGDQEVDAIVAATVPNSDALVRGVAHGLIISAASRRPRAWCEALIATARTNEWDDSAIETILQALPHERWTWELATAMGPMVEDAYWRGTRAFVMGGDALDVSYAIQKLTAASRAHDALRIASHGAKKGVPSSVLVEVLEAAVKQSVAVDSMFVHYVAEIMKVLDGRDDVPVATMLGLEWSYLSVLEHSQRPPIVLPRVLAEDPRHFIDLLKVAFRAETDDRSESVPPERARMAEQAYRLLDSWARIPGSRHDGSIDQARLEAWIFEARRLAGDVGRADIADLKIGQVLSAAGMGQDGNWPAEEVREMLELFPSESMRQGFVTGKGNRRGVTTRGLRDGGELEREEAARYQAWANAIRKAHRRTARVLDDLAARYTADAAHHDEQSERLDWES